MNRTRPPPTLLALLEGCRADPGDDAPRLVLADWLDDHGDPGRAEFVRSQVRTARTGDPEREALLARSRELLLRHGGGWLGPLWSWPQGLADWRRGLLSVRFPRSFDPAGMEDVLPWLEAALFSLQGRASLRRAAEVALSASGPAHAALDLRYLIAPEAVLEALAQVGEQPCLRTLAIGWPLRLLASSPTGEGRVPAVPPSFFRDLLALPMVRRLSRLASRCSLTPEQAAAVREAGVEPVLSPWPAWPFALPTAA